MDKKSLISDLRSYRIKEIAIFDYVSSVVGIILVCFYWFNTSLTKGVFCGALLAFPLGIAIHYIFNVKTTLNYKLGLSDKP